MNIAVIKSMVENYTIEQLKQAEQDLMDEQVLKIAVEGKDEGEKLTHILAAIYCKEELLKEGINLNQAIRAFSQRVRDSIS